MKKSSLVSYSLLALKIVLGLLFLFAAFMKLSGSPMMVAEFTTVGLGQWFRYFVAVWEVAGAVLLFVPSKRQYGALLLFLVCVGACIAQIFAIHQDWIHTVVLGTVLGFLIYVDRKRF